jgi:hypothetical protein
LKLTGYAENEEGKRKIYELGSVIADQWGPIGMAAGTSISFDPP